MLAEFSQIRIAIALTLTLIAATLTLLPRLEAQTSALYDEAMASLAELPDLNAELDALPYGMGPVNLPVGTFDAATGDFQWHCSLAREEVIASTLDPHPSTIVIPPDCPEIIFKGPGFPDISPPIAGGGAGEPAGGGAAFDLPDPGDVPTVEIYPVSTTHVASANAVLFNFVITITNNTRGVTVILNGESQLLRSGVSQFSRVLPLAGSVSFSLKTPDNKAFSVPRTQRDPETNRTYETRFRVDSPICGQIGVGYFVVPALPVAVVYQPPGDEPQALTLTTTQALSVSSLFSKAVTESADITYDKLGPLKAMVSVIGAIVSTDPSGGEAASETFERIGQVLETVSPVFEEQEMSETSVKVTDEHILDVSLSMSVTYQSDPALGQGAGDTFVYLKDVVFLWAGCSRQVKITPLVFRRVVATSAQSLSEDPELSSLLGLDPEWPPESPLGALAAERFASYEYENSTSQPQVHEARYEFKETHVSAKANLSTEIVEEDAFKGIAGFLGGDSEGTITTETTVEFRASEKQITARTIEATVVVEPFSTVVISYDILFGSFVVRELDPDGEPIPVEPSALFVRGNANNDARVNMADAQYIVNFLFLGGPTPSCLAAADCNDDEKINIADPMRLLGAIFLGGAPMPAPTVEPGLDPTPGIGCF